jgi:fused signal recognition particle receptor
MLGFSKKKRQSTKTSKSTLRQKLKSGLSRTRDSLLGGLGNVFNQKSVIDDTVLEDIEMSLLIADVGVEVTQTIIDDLSQRIKRKEFATSAQLLQYVQNALTEKLAPYAQPLTISQKIRPFIMFVVGVNGSGKTTTIGKIAYQLQQRGYSVMLAAGDTFRAAAIEQLKHWGVNNNIPVVSQKPGSDSAAVIYDAVQAAQTKNYDIVLADTAGRLHTQKPLMAELEKAVRVVKKLDSTAPHEIMLVLDSTIGQNAISQAKQFGESVQLNSVALTKLDGSAKGGVIMPVTQQLSLPVRYIGVGEGVNDLQPFDAHEFVQALFATNSEQHK